MTGKIGFIGCGNMGQAMLRGMLSSGAVSSDQVIISARTQATRSKMAEELGVETGSNTDVAKAADLLFLAVKPYLYEPVFAEIRPVLRSSQILVSIAPGKSIAWLQEQAGFEAKVIRTMPNTPAMVGEGMMGVALSPQVTEEEAAEFKKLCSGFSRSEVIAEHLMDVVTAVSGSSPAYVFMFIEAMADAAVAGGMPRKQAYEFAAQAVLGSAKMVLETGKHPGELKDMVCSPAGTTIQAVRVLEEKGMRSAVFEAMMKCLDISRKM